MTTYDAVNGRAAVTRDKFVRAVSKYRDDAYSAEDIGLLEWFWGWLFSEEIGGSLARASELCRYDAGNISRILRGKYDARLTNFLEAVRLLRAEIERQASGFVETVVTRQIETKLTIAHDRRYLALISGPTGRSKTLTVLRWARRHNHGATTYVRCRSGCTRHKLIRTIAAATGRSAISTMRSNMLEEELFRWFNSPTRRMLIVDEANHLLNHSSRQAVAMAFELLRDIYDICNATVVLILTNYDRSIFKQGPLAGFFEQFLGRNQCYLEIPDTIFDDEIAAICGAYVDDPPADLLEEAKALADGNDGKLRTLFEYLNLATEYAARDNLPFTGKLLRSVRKRHESGAADWPKQ